MFDTIAQESTFHILKLELSIAVGSKVWKTGPAKHFQHEIIWLLFE